MTEVIAIVSGNKGGVGKTVIASLIAYHLAIVGKKALVIDLGERGSSTLLLLGEDPGHPYLSDFFIGRATWSDVIVQSTFTPNLLVAPSTGEIGPVDPTSLEYLIDRVSKHVDFIVLDFPSYPGTLYDPLLDLARIHVVVFNPDALSYYSVVGWLKEKENLRKKLVLPVLNKYLVFLAEWKERAVDDLGVVFTLPFDSALAFTATRDIEEAYNNASSSVKKSVELLAYRLQKPLLKVSG
ncbi:MAG: AAA family ATPase [Infirmifilum sp.]